MISKEPLNRLTITVVAEDSVAYESPYLGQHGVSFLLTAQHGNTLKHILVDVAQNPAALVENINKMQLSLSCVDFVVLTHCHYDHTQGLARVLREIGKTDMPVVAHPDIFRLNFITDPYLRHVGIMDGDKEPDIEASGGTLYLTKDPLQLLPGIFSTGEVERTTDFEDPGMSLFTIGNKRLTHDLMLDDISLVANIEGKGLVIITGCSHAGIVNIVTQAIKLSGTEKIHGIIGGFHLVEAPETKIKKTTQALKEFDPDWIYAGHCTGFNAQVELANTFKDRFLPLRTGMVIEIP